MRVQPFELFQGSYSTFGRFQKQVLLAYSQKQGEESKDILKRHPEIAVFTEHSDSDGTWSPEECQQVLDVICKVQDKFPYSFTNGYQVVAGFWQEKIAILKEGLNHCIQNKCEAIFG